MANYYTENLAEFGSRERAIAGKLLSLPLPENFGTAGVRVAFNKNSGFVFLANDARQCAMLNGEELQIFHSTPHDGLEGFIDDLLSENEPGNLHRDDAEYIIECAKAEGIELTGEWKLYFEVN